jgi:lysozyme
MKISQNGIDLIKSFENFSPVVYPCPTGYPTIGWGHQVKKGEYFDVITKEEADEIMKNDLCFFENLVYCNVNVFLTQNQFDALVSFAYNNKPRNFLNSTLLKLLNNKKYKEAAQQFPRWIYGKGKILPGLVTRRQKEKELFLS